MNISMAPSKGMMYALYTDRVVYRSYEREALNAEELQDKLLELHLFDAENEYRYIKKRGGATELVINDEMMKQAAGGEQKVDIYKEKIYTLDPDEESLEVTAEDGGKSGSGSSKPDESRIKRNRIEVVNYIVYDENDLMTIPNYRLKEVSR